MSASRIRSAAVGLLVLSALLLSAAAYPGPQGSALDPSPPDHVVRLIFIHHSSGENWLADDNGGLGLALGENNYFVSDTNYGWGPDGIGDRTDIPNWLEWFRSESTDRAMQALFTEGEQHAAYTRTLGDPGGENEVILFKSCFPNSELEGQPADPPADEASLSVGGAKYVYNQLLDYFRTRPDKLFIVVTAPPVTNPGFAANARAFNEWLVNDWLRENGYSLPNVAVFDFYNLLTGNAHHHRLVDGQVEHSFSVGRNTSAYPSEDDHPSAAGNRKATQEFLPLLNAYYHQWQAGQPSQPGSAASPQPAESLAPPVAGAEPALVGLIDDFEIAPPASSAGWQPNWDASTPTSVACAPSTEEAVQGGASLRIDVDVAAGSWATCALFFDTPQDWSRAKGLSFQARFDPPGMPVDLDVYAGSAEALETYAAPLGNLAAAQGWNPIQLAWQDVQRVAWEEAAGAPLAKLNEVQGIAFGVGAPEGSPIQGTIWIDDLQLVGESDTQAPAATAEIESPSQPPSEDGAPRLPCASLGALPLALAALLGRRRLASRIR